MKATILAIVLALQCVTIHSVDLDGISLNDLYFGQPSAFNTTLDDCIEKSVSRDANSCGEDVTLTLYSNYLSELVDINNENWLRTSKAFNPKLETVFMVHGYGGGDDSKSAEMIRGAFALSNKYNFFQYNYGPVSRPPCYVEAVHNLKYISYCAAKYINNLVNAGLPAPNLKCIGHSLGAHICGHMTTLLPFRWHRIIALDPAAPLINPDVALSRDNAVRVHVLHTNAGFFGQTGRIGHVDVSLNNGSGQAFCSTARNLNGCSHFEGICNLAQALFEEYEQKAFRSSHACPEGSFSGRAQRSVSIPENFSRQQQTIYLGLNIAESVQGTFCLPTRHPAYCPKFLDGFGDTRCCTYDKLFT